MKQQPWSWCVTLAALAIIVIQDAHAQHHSQKTIRNGPNSRAMESSMPGRPIVCFSQIYEEILSNSNVLKSIATSLDAVRFGVQQANLLPNPTVGVQAENFAGSGSSDETEYTASVSQLIETGGKRHKRTEQGKARVRVHELQRDMAIAELMGNARVAYSNAIAAKSRLKLAEQEVAIRQNTVRLISRKSSYGGTLRLEVKKAELALESAELEKAQKVEELMSAKRHLVSLWGGETKDLRLTEKTLSIDRPELELEEFDVTESPAFALQEAARDREQFRLSVEKSQSIPDLTVSAGYRRLENSDNNAFIAGLSVPLAVFDRNQFGIASAKKRVNAGNEQLHALRIRLGAEAASLQARLRLLLSEKRRLETTIVPESKKVLTAATEAYRLGQVAYLDYLDAQTAYLDRMDRLITVVSLAIEDQVAIQKIKGAVIDRIRETQGACNET